MNSKAMEKAFSKLLKTDDQGFATFNGKRLMTSKGPVRKTALPNVPVS